MCRFLKQKEPFGALSFYTEEVKLIQYYDFRVADSECERLVAFWHPDVHKVALAGVHSIGDGEYFVAEYLGDLNAGSEREKICRNNSVTHLGVVGGNKRCIVGFLGRAGIGRYPDPSYLTKVRLVGFCHRNTVLVIRGWGAVK